MLYEYFFFWLPIGNNNPSQWGISILLLWVSTQLFLKVFLNLSIPPKSKKNNLASNYKK